MNPVIEKILNTIEDWREDLGSDKYNDIMKQLRDVDGEQQYKITYLYTRTSDEPYLNDCSYTINIIDQERTAIFKKSQIKKHLNIDGDDDDWDENLLNERRGRPISVREDKLYLKINCCIGDYHTIHGRIDDDCFNYDHSCDDMSDCSCARLTIRYNRFRLIDWEKI